jgi:uncharacterized protein (TIGR02231 family)
MVPALVLRGLLSAVPFPAYAPPPDETPLAASVAEVSIFRGSALVTRRAEVPAGGGRFVVHGLSGALVAGSVRLRLDGGEANGVEVREVAAAAVPEERIAALAARLAALRDDAAAANDEAELATATRVRVERLLDQEAAAHAGEVAAGRDATPIWERNFRWLDEALLAARAAERAAIERRDAANAIASGAAAELGGLRKDASLHTCDVAFDVVPQRDGAVPLALDYLVNQASWTPRYDLRADRELKRVDVVIRAEVSQQTGEDWKGVDVWLSTAQPQLGVVGPQARTAWLSLGGGDAGRVAKYGAAEAAESLKGLGYVGDDKDGAPRLDATVEAEGLSLRYRLARKETIESRPGASTVLVGRAALAVTAERVCTPALDANVWLRGRATNTSDFVLLPGVAAVFFGNDFLGESSLALVRPGQELTLHLGLDPALSVTRTHLEDQASTTGFFRKKRVHVDRWKVELENHGALATAPDGSVAVLVREVLPRTRDDRIEVELAECTPKLATGDRFDRARAELGVLTWSVAVPRDGRAEIVWKSRVEWPDDRELDGRSGFAMPPLSGGPWNDGRGPLLALLIAAGAAVAWAGRGVLRRGRIALPVVFALALFVPLPASAQDAVASRIERVTVFGRGAMVERTATLPAAGKFVLRDLPADADPASIRVKLAGGEVAGVEVRERHERALPDASVEALRTKVRDLAGVVAKLDDERASLDVVLAHLQKLMGAPPPPAGAASSAAPPGVEARPDAGAWEHDLEFLRTRLSAKKGEARRNAKELAAAREALAAAERDLASGGEASLVVRDVVVDAASTASGPLACELSYLVDAAGWTPEYELRAVKDLSRAALTYRARVWQGTTESWRDVDLWLSTAQPQRGAQGPDPRAQWLSLRSGNPGDGFAVMTVRSEDLDAHVERAAAAAPAPAPRAPPFAAVADEGLSVRFHVPDRPTIAPREGGTSLLIGRTELPLAPRRACVPELDPTVWLSAKCTNTSDWVLLPGVCAVHLGSDYVGKGAVARTLKGQEFDVHLGPDPFVSVERIELEGQLQTSAFSSKGTQSHAWRLRFENHGAPSSERDGRIVVDVQEALPKARDERIAVRLDSAKPEPSSAADDRKAREDRGILTWHLALAAQGKAEIEWRWSAKYPEGEPLVRTLE